MASRSSIPQTSCCHLTIEEYPELKMTFSDSRDFKNTITLSKDKPNPHESMTYACSFMWRGGDGPITVKEDIGGDQYCAYIWTSREDFTLSQYFNLDSMGDPSDTFTIHITLKPGKTFKVSRKGSAFGRARNGPHILESCTRLSKNKSLIEQQARHLKVSIPDYNSAQTRAAAGAVDLTSGLAANLGSGFRIASSGRDFITDRAGNGQNEAKSFRTADPAQQPVPHHDLWLESVTKISSTDGSLWETKIATPVTLFADGGEIGPNASFNGVGRSGTVPLFMPFAELSFPKLGQPACCASNALTDTPSFLHLQTDITDSKTSVHRHHQSGTPCNTASTASANRRLTVPVAHRQQPGTASAGIFLDRSHSTQRDMTQKPPSLSSQHADSRTTNLNAFRVGPLPNKLASSTTIRSKVDTIMQANVQDLGHMIRINMLSKKQLCKTQAQWNLIMKFTIQMFKAKCNDDQANVNRVYDEMISQGMPKSIVESVSVIAHAQVCHLRMSDSTVPWP